MLGRIYLTIFVTTVVFALLCLFLDVDSDSPLCIATGILISFLIIGIIIFVYWAIWTAEG